MCTLCPTGEHQEYEDLYPEERGLKSRLGRNSSGDLDRFQCRSRTCVCAARLLERYQHLANGSVAYYVCPQSFYHFLLSPK